MVHKIPLVDLVNVVNRAYEMNKGDERGVLDRRIASADTSKFAIAVVLADGTSVKRGDCEVYTPLGDIAGIATSVVLLSQYQHDEMVRECGLCQCFSHIKKEDIPICPHSLCAVSAVRPIGDTDAKWGVLADNLIDMIGSEPRLNDDLYRAMTDEYHSHNVIEALAGAHVKLLDDAEPSLDLLTRLTSLQVTTGQLAMMAATIAADGRCPRSSKVVFDRTITPRVVTLMALDGQHRLRRQWMMRTGLPARFSFGGAIVGVLPGVMGIAAYSPLLSDVGISVRATKAITHITTSLGLNVFSADLVQITK